MVSLDTINQSNARIASSLPAGLVALFIGATKGIGQSTLEHLARHAPPAARIYSVARPGAAAAAHEELLASLRRARPDAAFTLVTADVSLVSEVDRVAAAVAQDAKKLDLLVLSAGYMPMGPRDEDTREGLDPVSFRLLAIAVFPRSSRRFLLSFFSKVSFCTCLRILEKGVLLGNKKKR